MSWKAALQTTKAVAKGDALSVPFSNSPILGGPDLPHLEVYFDGSVSTKDGNKHGGIAAIVLGPINENGTRKTLASKSIALPTLSDSTAAEGHAASLATKIVREVTAKLADTWDTSCSVRFYGDNPTIIGLCTGLTSTRRAHVRAAADEAVRHSRANYLTTTWIHIPRAHNKAHAAALAASKRACSDRTTAQPFVVSSHAA